MSPGGRQTGNNVPVSLRPRAADPAPGGAGIGLLDPGTLAVLPEVPADGEGAEPSPGHRQRRWRVDWWGVWDRLRQPHSVITLLVVAACVVFTFVQLQPSQLFKNTTPAGGDMGAHVWLPDYVKRALLPHWRITGWTPDWYAGFPALTYYFPLPIVAIALVSYVIPYDVAFKLVSVLGLVTLPLAAWAFGRLSRLPFPTPACLAVASVGYLFSRDFTIYGGNIASTMAGEFSFSISLSFALLFLGVAARGLRSGRLRALAAVLLACTALCHILPLFFAVGGAALLWLFHPSVRRMKWIVPVFVVGGCLVAFWALPFYFRLPYATNMGYQKLSNYIPSLFPSKDVWLFVLAGVGILLSIVRRRRIGVWLSAMTVLAALVFRTAPQARLWNARVLPFWFLCLYLLVGVALAELGTLAAEAWSTPRNRTVALLPIPVVALLIGLIWVGYPLRLLPFGHTTSSGRYSWLGISSPASSASFVPDWVNWNYSGYESPGKARRGEYFSLVRAMSALGQNPTDGCGRAMWEYEPGLDQMGTPDALMLLPYWTKGCIGSMEGLYYESSATTPYHFLNVSELSAQPSDPVRGLTYSSSPNVAEGVAHLQMLGVKYFMALTPNVQNQADAVPALQLVSTVGPFAVSETTGSTAATVQRTWKIYKIAGSQMVTPLANQPVVVKGAARNGSTWLRASQQWYLTPKDWDVYEAASGPKSWARVPMSDPSPPRTPLPPVQVSHISSGTESMSFDVDQTGVPVLIKTSYFPNWQASGAGTVYRVTPNLMVVVPTSHHVTLRYGYTPVDWAGFLLSLLGLVGVAGLVWFRPPVPRWARRAGIGSPAGPDLDDVVRRSVETDRRMGPSLLEPYRRLGFELGDSYPGGMRRANDLDAWLGHPDGLGGPAPRPAGQNGSPTNGSPANGRADDAQAADADHDRGDEGHAPLYEPLPRPPAPWTPPNRAATGPGGEEPAQGPPRGGEVEQ